MFHAGLGKIFGDGGFEFLVDLVPKVIIEAAADYFGAGPVLTAILFFVLIAVVLLAIYRAVASRSGQSHARR